MRLFRDFHIFPIVFKQKLKIFISKILCNINTKNMSAYEKVPTYLFLVKKLLCVYFIYRVCWVFCNCSTPKSSNYNDPLILCFSKISSNTPKHAIRDRRVYKYYINPKFFCITFGCLSLFHWIYSIQIYDCIIF